MSKAESEADAGRSSPVAPTDAPTDGDESAGASSAGGDDGRTIGHHDVDLAEPVDLDIAGRIGRAWRELRRGGSNSVVRDYFFGQGADALEYGQMDTLDVLIREPSWRMSDLAIALRVDPSTATRAVQRLVTPGLVERLTDSEDGRVVIVRITDAGRELHGRIDTRRGIVLSQLMSAFDDQERHALADLMTRFVIALDEVVKDLPHCTK